MSADTPMHPPMVRQISAPLTFALATLVLAAAPAGAAQRFASPTASPAASACTVFAPCTADVAINSAAIGDEVVLAPGTYAVANPITITKAITVRGDASGPRPVLQATLSTALVAITAPGSSLSHVEVRASGVSKPAISVEAAATVDRVVAISNSGTGIDVLSDATPPVVRNSVAVTHGADSGAGVAGLRTSDGPNGGTVEIRNVTARADAANSVGFRCRTTTATTTIVNTIARGTTSDVDASVPSGQTPKCPATTSNARAAYSPGFTPTFTADPLFTDAAAGNYRPLTGSSTTDAGTTAAQNGTLDLDGAARTQGTATDVGAYELTPAGPPPAAPGPGAGAGAPAPADPADTTTDPVDTTSSTPATTAPTTPAPATDASAPRATVDPPAAAPQLPPAAPPALGTRMLLDTGKGDVLVKLPGTNRFIALRDASSLPFGTTIDATKGEVTLNTALPGGKQQSGTFSGGQFEVRQSKGARGMTDIHLRGAFATTCKRKTVARAAARKSKTLRRLWGKDKGGKFRTHGRDSVATVRGTKWLTEDRCDGTLTKVTEGAVDVRSKRGGKTRRVKAGQSLLVRR